MKYCSVNVKCGMSFIEEVNLLAVNYSAPGNEFIYDFLIELKSAAKIALDNVRLRVHDPECHISAEFVILCPLSVYNEATRLLTCTPKNCTDVALMMEHIAALSPFGFSINARKKGA